MYSETLSGLNRAESKPTHIVDKAGRRNGNDTADVPIMDTALDNSKITPRNFHANYIKASRPQNSSESTIDPSIAHEPQLESINPEIVNPADIAALSTRPALADNNLSKIEVIRGLQNDASLTTAVASADVINPEAEVAALIETRLGSAIKHPPSVAQSANISGVNVQEMAAAQTLKDAEIIDIVETETATDDPGIELDNAKIKDAAISASSIKDLQPSALNSASEKPAALPSVNVIPDTQIKSTQIKALSSPPNFTALPQSHPAIQTVSRNLVLAQETQKGISIRLDPPEMGRVFIDFQFDADKNVTAIIRSELAETSQILKDKSDFFQQILKDNGLNDVNFNFEHNENQSRQGFDFDKDTPTKFFETNEDLENYNQTHVTQIKPHYNPLDTAKIDIKL